MTQIVHPASVDIVLLAGNFILISLVFIFIDIWQYCPMDINTLQFRSETQKKIF